MICKTVVNGSGPSQLRREANLSNLQGQFRAMTPANLSPRIHIMVFFIFIYLFFLLRKIYYVVFDKLFIRYQTLDEETLMSNGTLNFWLQNIPEILKQSLSYNFQNFLIYSTTRQNPQTHQQVMHRPFTEEVHFFFLSFRFIFIDTKQVQRIHVRI